jgi:hypothetical protein
VEEMFVLPYNFVIVKSQVGESIAEGGSSETSITVENRKIMREEGRDKH